MDLAMNSACIALSSGNCGHSRSWCRLFVSLRYSVEIKDTILALLLLFVQDNLIGELLPVLGLHRTCSSHVLETPFTEIFQVSMFPWEHDLNTSRVFFLELFNFLFGIPGCFPGCELFEGWKEQVLLDGKWDGTTPSHITNLLLLIKGSSIDQFAVSNGETGRHGAKRKEYGMGWEAYFSEASTCQIIWKYYESFSHVSLAVLATEWSGKGETSAGVSLPGDLSYDTRDNYWLKPEVAVVHFKGELKYTWVILHAALQSHLRSLSIHIMCILGQIQSQLRNIIEAATDTVSILEFRWPIMPTVQ